MKSDKASRFIVPCSVQLGAFEKESAPTCITFPRGRLREIATQLGLEVTAEDGVLLLTRRGKPVRNKRGRSFGTNCPYISLISPGKVHWSLPRFSRRCDALVYLPRLGDGQESCGTVPDPASTILRALGIKPMRVKLPEPIVILPGLPELDWFLHPGHDFGQKDGHSPQGILCFASEAPGIVQTFTQRLHCLADRLCQEDVWGNVMREGLS